MRQPQFGQILLVAGFSWLGVSIEAIAQTVPSLDKSKSIVRILRDSQATKETFLLSEVKRPLTSAQLLVQSPIPEIVQVTAVEANPTEQGVEVILQTTVGEQLTVVNRSSSNSYIADIPNAQLRLPNGEAFVFRSQKPITGITEISVTNANANTIRVTVTGDLGVPTVELFDSSQEGLVFGVAAVAASSPPQQQPPMQPTPPVEPESATQRNESLAEEEEIEVFVTGDRETGYRVPDASTATRTDTPLRNIPQSIQVVPQQVLEDQQVTRLDQALRNVSGVTSGSTNLGRNLEFNIRGFDGTPILRDGFRQFGADVFPETANLERVEVLKGPASVLYGESEPGGLINLVTKKPTSTPFYEIEAQFGNRNFISPRIDFSGPLTDDGKLLYRLNALYRTNDDIQDVDRKVERLFISPVVTWKISDRTDLTFELEFLTEKRPPSFGIPAIGNRIADIPFDRITNEPDDFGKEEYISVGYDLEHRFNDNWELRNAFRFTRQNALLEVAYPFEIDEETGTVTRFWAAQPQKGESYSLQTSAIGKVATGAVDHELLFGIDLNFTRDNFNDLIRLDDANPLELNLFDPLYRTASRPDFDQLPLISDRETETRRLGVFVQDRVSFSDSFFLLAGLRYDTVEQIVTNNPTDFDPTSTETTQNNDALIPRIGLVYKPIEEISLYASYSQSFAPNIETTSGGEALNPERGEGFEVGIKSELLESKLFATLAYFNITKQNVASEDPDDPFSFVATGEQASQGIELDVSGEILPGWNIIASYAYIDAKVTEDNLIAIGNRLPNAPRHSAGLWTTYEIQLGDLQGLGFGVGFNFVGDRVGDLENSFEVDSYFLTNAAVFYQRDNWRAALNFRNLFDVDYIAGTSLRERGNDRGEPFTVLGSISVRF